MMKNHSSRLLFLPGLLLFIVFFSSPLLAQEDLLKELEQGEAPKKEYTIATFKGTRVVNGHSAETKGEGELEFIISHRFGQLNSGAYEFFGLDQAFIRIGLEYGITDRLGAGVGRSSFNKIIDGYLKYKITAQSKGPGSFPLTITAFASTNLQTYPQNDADTTISTSDRLTYTGQLIFARKLSSKLSFQFAPTIVHTNLVNEAYQNNDHFALGFGGRYKLTKSLALNAEYYYRIDPHENTPYYNSLGFGFDIETGGHVFQLIFSNTQGMIERTFITETAGDFSEGDIHFGFNITRTFQLKKNKKGSDW